MPVLRSEAHTCATAYRDDCQIPGPFDVRTPAIPFERVAIGHLRLDRPVEWVGLPVRTAPYRARQRAVLTVAGQRFTRTVTAYGAADPYRVTIGGRRLLISAIYGQTWEPPACGSGPCRGPIPFAGDDCFGWTELRRRRISAYDSDPAPGHTTCNPVGGRVAA